MTPPPPGPSLFGSGHTRDAWLCAFVMLTVAVSRLPAILCPLELNPDESLTMVQALRYSHDWLPWRSADSTTGGPVNAWFLTLAHSIGIPVNYHAAHLLAALLLGAILVAAYLTLRKFCAFRESATVAVATTIAVAFASTSGLVQFASETVPALALALAAYCCVSALRRNGPSTSRLAIAAALAGLAPWAKLQALPSATFTAGFAIWLACRLDRSDNPSLSARARAALFVCAAGLLPSAAILIPVWTAGAFPDFWNSYIVANLAYAKNPSAEDAFARGYDLLFTSDVSGLIKGSLILAVAWCLFRLSGPPEKARPRETLFLFFATASTAAALAGCIRSPFTFDHYQIWTFAPLMLFAGALLLPLDQALRAAPIKPVIARFGRIALMACLIAPVIVRPVTHRKTWIFSREKISRLTQDPDNDPNRTFAHAIVAAAPKARTMAVWGWMPSLYLETGLTSVTRHATCHYLIDQGPSRDFLRASFMKDVRDTTPDVIVDAVASGCFIWFWDVKSSGIESFPELDQYVKTHYRLAASPALSTTPMRIFVRQQNDGSTIPAR